MKKNEWLKYQFDYMKGLGFFENYKDYNDYKEKVHGTKEERNIIDEIPESEQEDFKKAFN